MIGPKEAAMLARYRVDDGTLGYHAKVMNKDQIIARRAYMRGILRVNFYWCKMNNNQLDHMRLYKLGDDFIVEDTNYIDYVLHIDRRPDDGKQESG